MNKRRVTRVSAILCAAALSVSALNFEPFTSFIKTSIVAEADSAGGAGGGSNSGVIGGMDTVTDGYCLPAYGHNTGYRIYLAPNRVWLSGNAINNMSVGVTENTVKLLDDYRNMCLYEITCTCGGGNMNCGHAVNSGTATLYGFQADAKNSTLSQLAVPSSQILSKDAGDNSTPDFGQLFKGIGNGSSDSQLSQNSSLVAWGDLDTMSYNFTYLKKWANERFMNLDEHQAAVTKFLSNYKSLVDDSLWKSSGYPANYDEFVTGQWAIVVEPISLMAAVNTSNVYAISYQDYLSLELGDPAHGKNGNLDRTMFDNVLGGQTQAGSADKMSGYYNDGWYYSFAKSGKLRFAMPAYFYNDFSVTLDDTKHDIDTSPTVSDLSTLSVGLKEYAPTAGFAIYTAWDDPRVFGGSNVLSANQNYFVVQSSDYVYRAPYDSTCVTSQFTLREDNGQITDDGTTREYADSKVYRADLLSTNFGLKGISAQHFDTSDEFKKATGTTGAKSPASDAHDEFSDVLNWGDKTLANVYPKAKFFNYAAADNPWYITNTRDTAAKAIPTTDKFAAFSSKVVCGDSSSANTYDKDSSGYYLKTFYSTSYKYYVSRAGVNVNSLRKDMSKATSTRDYSFYVYPDSAYTQYSESDDTRIFYAGSKFAAGLKDSHASSISDYKDGRNQASNMSGVTVSGVATQVPAPSLNFASKNGVFDANTLGVKADSAWNFASELSMYALANSNISVSVKGDVKHVTKNSSKNKPQSVSESVTVLCKDTKVTSYITYGGIDNDDNVYSGKYATLDANDNATYTETGVLDFTYSVVDTKTTDDSVVTIADKSQSGKPVFVIAIPNSEVRTRQWTTTSNVGAYGYNLSEVDSINFYNDFFETAKSKGRANLNSINGINSLAATLNDMGVDRRTCTIKLATADTAAKEATKIVLGAYGGNRSKTANAKATPLMGYSIYVIEDFRTSDAIDCEGQLKAYELNYVYPTILCETDAKLITLSVADCCGEVNLSKTSSYSGNLINFNATNKIALLNYANKGYFRYAFANEQTDPKVFTYDTMTYKGYKYENVDYEYGTSYLTHAVHLTRGAFGDSPVVSSISARSSTLTPEYLSKMGVTTGNKGRNTVDASGTIEIRTNYDVFRWSANKGLPLIHNGQLVYISPFSQEQSIRSAGYNLTTKAYAYIANDRPVGDKVTSGVLPDSLVVPQNGGLTYKMLSTEAYDTILKFYPEYKMVSYIFNEDVAGGEITKLPTKTFTYMMSDKVRRVKAAGLYSISTSTESNPLTGTIKSDTIATGTAAKDLSQRLGNLQVVYAGGNINLATQNNFEIKLGGFVLDQIDKSIDTDKLVGARGEVYYTNIIADGSFIKQNWDNAAYDAAAEYKSWVSEVKNNLAVEPMLSTYNGNRLVKTYNGFTANMGNITGGEVTGMTTYVLTFKNGAVVEDNAFKALIKAIAVESCGNNNPTDEQIATAKKDFMNSKIAASILSAIESNTDNDNTSEQAEAFGNKKWYDEEVRSFVIRQYHTTPLKIGSIVVSDKIDITAGPSQTGTADNLFSNGYIAKWGMTFYFKAPISSNPSMIAYVPTRGNINEACNSGGVIAYNVPVKGADFIISDATTADARN